MKLRDKTYDVLKWVALIGVPALAAAYADLAAVWGWPLSDEIVRTAAHVGTLLGALLGVSTAEYRKDRL